MNRRERIALREAEALVERETEQYVRDKMRPTLVAHVRDATARFFRRDGVGTPVRRR